MFLFSPFRSPPVRFGSAELLHDIHKHYYSIRHYGYTKEHVPAVHARTYKEGAEREVPKNRFFHLTNSSQYVIIQMHPQGVRGYRSPRAFLAYHHLIADITEANAVSPMKINSIISLVVSFLFGFFFAIPLSSFLYVLYHKSGTLSRGFSKIIRKF